MWKLLPACMDSCFLPSFLYEQGKEAISGALEAGWWRPCSPVLMQAGQPVGDRVECAFRQGHTHLVEVARHRKAGTRGNLRVSQSTHWYLQIRKPHENDTEKRKNETI